MKIKISKNFLDGYVKVLDLGGVGKHGRIFLVISKKTMMH